MQLRIQYGDDQVMPISNYQMLYHGHRCHQTPEGCFLKEQSSFPINGLPHNPVINKRIIVTDTSLYTRIIVSNCLKWDFLIAC